jgi:endopeptidase Clp ATP-binding regulatory subunit ClpX
MKNRVLGKSNIWSIIFIILVIAGLYSYFRFRPKYISLGTVVEQAAKGEIAQIDVKGNSLKISYIDKQKASTVSSKEPQMDLMGFFMYAGLGDKQINRIQIKFHSSPNWSIRVASFLLLLVTGVIYWGALQLQDQLKKTNILITEIAKTLKADLEHRRYQASASSSSRSSILERKNQFYTYDPSNHSDLSFSGIGGQAQAKKELKLIIDFLRNPIRYGQAGAHTPRGIILAGPPGSGKTILARAMAGEASVPFFFVNASEFVELYIGLGASRIRSLFLSAKQNSPCIVFIDEIDSIGGRISALSGGDDERNQTINQLLAEMDGFDSNSKIIVVGATNRPQDLDHALTRPGRFDYTVSLHLPNESERLEILQIHTREKHLASDVSLQAIAKTIVELSGAEIAGLVNDAAINAAEAGRIEITMNDFNSARGKATISFDNIPAPQEIFAHLSKYVIAQDNAKKTLAVAIRNHYMRIEASKQMEENHINVSKSNVLIIGPSGTGKTHLVETAANFFQVPYAIVNATMLTKTGYVGADAELILYKLLENSGFNIKRAQYGIVCIDEVDKLAHRPSSNADAAGTVSSIGVQQDLLKIIEGTKIDIAKAGKQLNGSSERYSVDTRNILFICMGAFVGLEEAVNRRLGITKASRDQNTLAKVQQSDIIAYGMIPEFVGRLPIISYTTPLEIDDLSRILTEPKDALVRQYRELLRLQGIDLKFSREAIQFIAQEAISTGVGARGLRSILEKVLLQAMFDGPERQGLLIVDKNFIESWKGAILSPIENQLVA